MYIYFELFFIHTFIYCCVFCSLETFRQENLHFTRLPFDSVSNLRNQTIFEDFIDDYVLYVPDNSHSYIVSFVSKISFRKAEG